MKTNQMNREFVKRTFFRFFVPTVVSSLAIAIISVTDMAIAGNFIGSEALSAISISLPIVLLINVACAIFGTGAAILMSKSLGEGNQEKSNIIYTDAIIFALIFSLLIVVFGNVFMQGLLKLCGAGSQQMCDISEQYVRPLVCGMVSMILSPVLLIFLRNDSRPSEAMKIVLGCGLINLAGDVITVKVFHLGLSGIAYSTVFAETLSVLVALFLLLKRRSAYKLVRPQLKWIYFAGMFRGGSSLAMVFLLQIVLTSYINKVLYRLGGIQGVAVYAVVKYIITFIYALYDGVTGAMQPMLGIYIGGNEKDNVHLTAKISRKVIITIGVSLTVVLEITAPFICKIFGVDAGMMDMTTQAIRIQALFCTSAAFIAYLNSFYRCTKHETLSLMITIVNNFIFPIVLISMLSTYMTGTIHIVFIGLVCSDVLTLLLWLLLVRSMSRHNYGEGCLLINMQDGEEENLYAQVCEISKENVEKIMADASQVCEEQEIPPKHAYYVTLCIEELLVNLANMAESGGKKGMVDVRLDRIEDDQIVLRIRDDLIEFNPLGQTFSSAQEVFEQEDFDMIGINMAVKMAKECYYKRTIGLNDFQLII